MGSPRPELVKLRGAYNRHIGQEQRTVKLVRVTACTEAHIGRKPHASDLALRHRLKQNLEANNRLVWQGTVRGRAMRNCEANLDPK